MHARAPSKGGLELQEEGQKGSQLGRLVHDTGKGSLGPHASCLTIPCNNQGTSLEFNTFNRQVFVECLRLSSPTMFLSMHLP